ncbi:MAG TPA: PEP-CTERM sorting domain-containing protein, partial [Candidatus Spyradosoma merdigallinarum]|nr:PEP-CTERM sorting domain-containing protein [Candidatus Spyradosoma merdigallinarum]
MFPKNDTKTCNNGGVAVSIDNVQVSYSAIPEPSAFGLLAGLGALALVASRRRRK